MAGANNENYWTAVIAADPATIISRVQLSLYDGETEERMMVKYDRKIASLLNLNGDAAEKAAARNLAGAKTHPTDIKSCQRMVLVTHSNFPHINDL